MSTPVVELIARVMQDVQAVRKSDRNESQGFNFRGIDAVMNAVGPALRERQVTVTPYVVTVDRTTVEVGQRRTPMGHVTVVVDYTFTGPAGDSITGRVAGEAMDSGDKATAKAMSVAFRTFLLQALCLPTDEPDPDHDVYERAPAALTAEEFHAAQQRMKAATTLDALQQAGKAVAELPLSTEQRDQLRHLFLEVKAGIDQDNAEAAAQVSADADEQQEAMIP